MEMLVKHRHKVVLLTTVERGYLHQYVETLGIITESVDIIDERGKISFYRKNFQKLRSVVKKYKINIIIAHQQVPALLAGLFVKFRKVKLVYVRHNSDEDYQHFPKKAKWLNKIVNYLTPVKVAPSSVVKNFMIFKEGVPPKQIVRVNYGYNFDQYEKPDPAEVSKIKKAYPAQLLILSIARLVAAKRHREMFEVVSQLKKDGIDCKLVCLGSGPMEKEIQQLIFDMGLDKSVFLEGNRDNIFDYIEAADVFLHLSSTEASNSAVKEAALCKKTVIVCKGVGDFEDYIQQWKNGFLVHKENPVPEAYAILKKIYTKELDKQEIGSQFFETVTSIFHINKIGKAYNELLLKVLSH